jgi:hypothetical protein
MAASMRGGAERAVNDHRQGFGNRQLLQCGSMQQPSPDPHTSSPRTTPLGSARDLAQGISGTLRMARALAEAGRPIDLAGLDDPVGLLCAKSLDLPPAQGRQMRVLLIALRQEIDVLSAVLRAKKS